MRFGLSKNSAGNFLLVCASASSPQSHVSVCSCALLLASWHLHQMSKKMYQIYVYIYVENFRSFAHLLHTPVRRLMKSVYDNSVGATAMCSLRCAHTPPQPRYVLTALRAYARLFDVISIVYDYRFVTMPAALLYHGPLFRPNPVGVSGEYPQATPG